MSEEANEEEKPAFEKGDRAAIVKGRKNVGVRGQVFWIGDNKYGDGKRYGLRGDDGETYWVDGTNIGPEEGAPPAPDAPPPKETFAKGSRVSITKGPSAGVEGEVFWVGESKYGVGMRYGIKDGSGETHWADSNQVDLLAPPSPDAPRSGGGGRPASGQNPGGQGAGSFADDAPLPDGEDSFGAAGVDDFASGPDGFSDDVPFDGDDIPF